MTTQPAVQPSVTPRVLEDRLVDFGVSICRVIRRLPANLVGIQISRQLVRSATSPAANYAEARAAESRRDFVHKMQICLKELRETSVWLRFAEQLGRKRDGVREQIEECDQLIAIFVCSIKTAKNNRG
jgi:four helix bundle protein